MIENFAAYPPQAPKRKYVLRQAKKDLIEQLGRDSQKVAITGYRVNDAAALAAPDLRTTMSTGADVAI